MKIQKIIQERALPAETEFVFSEKTVQGAKTGKKDDLLFVRSPRRFKLYTDGCDEVTFLEGAGHFKWARGETPFAAGDCFITAVLCKPSRIYIMPMALPAVNPNGIPHFNFSGL